MMNSPLRELSGCIVAELVESAAVKRWDNHPERTQNEDRRKQLKDATAASSSTQRRQALLRHVSDTGPLRIARELIDSCDVRIPFDVRLFLKHNFFTLKFSGGYSLLQCRFGGVTKRSQLGNKCIMEGILDTLKLEQRVAPLNVTRPANEQIELHRHGILRFPELPKHILATSEWFFVELRDRTNHLAVRFYQDMPGLEDLFGYRFMTVFARGIQCSSELMRRASLLLGESVASLLSLPDNCPRDELVENGKYAAEVSLHHNIVFPLIISTGRSGIWSDGDLKSDILRDLLAASPSKQVDDVVDFLNAISPCDGIKFSKCTKCGSHASLESDEFWDRAQETLVFAYNSWKCSSNVTDRYDPAGMVDGLDWRI